MPKTCSVCSKVFPTKAALKSHVFSAHSAQASALYSTGGSVSRRAGASGGKGMGGVVGLGAGLNGRAPTTFTSTNSIRQSGTGRIFAKDLTVAETAAGSVIVDLVLACGTARRLGLLARAFQRVRWLSLRFDIEPKGNVMNSGGYIAAFLADPEDEATDAETLAGSSGAQSGKWWETRSVVARVPSNMLFTSDRDAEGLRFHSPGRLVVISDGTSASPVTMTINMHWSVELSVPSAEERKAVAPTYTNIVDLYPKKGANHFAAKDGTWFAHSLLTPSPPIGTVFRLPVPVHVEWAEGTGDSGTQIYWFIKVVKDSTEQNPCLRWYTDGDCTTPGQNWQSDLAIELLIPRGLLFPVFKAPENLTGSESTIPRSSSGRKQTRGQWSPTTSSKEPTADFERLVRSLTELQSSLSGACEQLMLLSAQKLPGGGRSSSRDPTQLQGSMPLPTCLDEEWEELRSRGDVDY